MQDGSHHVLEELRSMRSAHIELMTQMGNVCGEVKCLVTELRHTKDSFDSVSIRVSDVEQQIQAMAIESAQNKPILDIARSMNRNLWVSIFAGMAAVAGTNLDKLAG